MSRTFRAGTHIFLIPLNPWNTKIKGSRVRIVCMQTPLWISKYVVSRPILHIVTHNNPVSDHRQREIDWMNVFTYWQYLGNRSARKLSFSNFYSFSFMPVRLFIYLYRPPTHLLSYGVESSWKKMHEEFLRILLRNKLISPFQWNFKIFSSFEQLA